MIITVKNLGVIKKAEFDTSKKLTVFCGPNSTGKTYLSYVINAIYGLVKYPENYKLDSFQKVYENWIKGKKISIKKTFIREALSNISKQLDENKGKIFGITDEKAKKIFDNFNLSFSITDKETKEIIHLGVENELNKSFKENSNNLEESWYTCLMKIISSTTKVFNAYMIPIERLYAHTEKYFGQMIENALQVGVTYQPQPEINNQPTIDYVEQPSIVNIWINTFSNLPMATTNCFLNTINIQEGNGELHTLAENIENKLLYGNISLYNKIEEYTSNNIRLPYTISSSMVKSLSDLVLTLKYKAHKNDLLIMDEPEMNLHPNNQVILAEILAKISNNTPILVSTHSDYIIRELNNLIVAKSLEKKGKNTYKKYYDNDSLLDYKDVQVLYFNFGKDGKVNVKNLNVDEYGFAVDSMDETINKQNERMQILFGQMDD